MSEEFKNITDRQTDTHTELVPELLWSELKRSFSSQANWKIIELYLGGGENDKQSHYLSSMLN